MTHSVVIHALMVSWYPKRRPSNPTNDVMIDLDHWMSPGVVEVVEEAYESPCLMKKPLKKCLDPQVGHSVLKPSYLHGDDCPLAYGSLVC